MNPTRLPSAAAGAVSVMLLAFAAPAVAQNPSYPTTPSNPTSAPPADASQDHSVTTAPAASTPAVPDDPLYHLLRRLQMPQPSGPVKEPPAEAAVIVVHVPDASAEVLFDGEPTCTAGTTRYFVTSDLPDGQMEKYTVSARWKQHGESVKREHKIEAEAGQIQVVDFTRPDGK